MKIQDYFTVDRQGWKLIKDNNKFLLDWTGLSFGRPSTRIGIYVIGNFYVGRSVDVRKRVLTHFKSAINNCHYNEALGSAISTLLFSNRMVPVHFLQTDNGVELEGEVYKILTEKGYHLFNIDDPNNPRVPSYKKTKAI